MKLQQTTSGLMRHARCLIFAALGFMLCAAAKAQTTYQSVVLADDPLAYYALNPGTDGTNTAPDLSGNDNDGSATNIIPAMGPTSYITNAANFNGSSSLVNLSMGNNPGLLIFNGPITLEAWVQPASSSVFGDIIAEGYENASGYPEITLRVNGPYGADFVGGSENADFSVYVSGGSQTTNWTYVVASMDGTNSSLYENGVLVARSPDTNGSTIFPSPDPWVIGDGSDAGNTRFFDGNISEVAMYNYGLTAAQVLAHYNFALYGTTNPPPPGVGPSLKWSPNNNSGVWNTDASTNWISLSNNQASVFNANDPVLFDDTAGVPTNVTVSGTVAPYSITVNSSANAFTFSGSGTIAGSGGLVKEGSSLLTITSPGSFTGPVTISGGAVYAGNNCFDAVSSITITNNSTLDLAGGTFSDNTPVTVSGTGLSGEGAIYNSYADYPQELLNITMAGDTKFGGSARWDLASGSEINGPHNLTLDWSAGAGGSIWNTVTIGAGVLDVLVTNGSALGFSYMDSSCQNPSTMFTIGPNGQLIFYSGGFNGSFSVANGATVTDYNGGVAFNGSTIHLFGGSTVYLYGAGTSVNGNNLILESNALLASYDSSGADTVGSAVTLNGVAHFVLGDHSINYTNVVSGPGGFVLDYYNNEVVFSESNTYSGPTIIGSGGNSPEVALTGNGSISQSSLIFFGGASPNTVHVDVSGRSDQTLTLASGQTLAGIGVINGSLVVSPGATISPSGTNTTIGITTGSNSTGAITAYGAIVLNGTTVMKLNGSGVNDEVVSDANITYGGTLNLVNISGAPLAVGDSFQLFSGYSYTGSFASITPSAPGAGLAWDTSQLNNGVLNVMAAPPQPAINSVAISAGSLVFSGTNGTASGTFYVLTTTNLAIPLTNWVTLATNSFDSSGNFSVTNTVNQGTPQRFYQIEVAP